MIFFQIVIIVAVEYVCVCKQKQRNEGIRRHTQICLHPVIVIEELELLYYLVKGNLLETFLQILYFICVHMICADSVHMHVLHILCLEIREQHKGNLFHCICLPLSLSASIYLFIYDTLLVGCHNQTPWHKNGIYFSLESTRLKSCQGQFLISSIPGWELAPSHSVHIDFWPAFREKRIF